MSVISRAAPPQPERPPDAELATTADDIRASQAVRYREFTEELGADLNGADKLILVEVHEFDASNTRHSRGRVTKG